VSGTYTRVSQAVAEVLQNAADPVRVTQVALEAASGGLGHVRISQAVLEVLGEGSPDAVRISQAVAEVVIATLGYVRVSQVAAEAAIATLGFTRITQCVLEALVSNTVVDMPVVYPTLVGLTYSVTKRPIFNTGVATTAALNDIVVTYTQTPIWEFDLSYDYLPDYAGGGTTASDLKTLMGFFLSTQGGFMPFCFTDPDDNSVTAQAIGTGDGTTTNFTLVRTYGGSDGTGTEPIGYFNASQPYSVYVGGTLKTPGTDYTIVTTTPVNQQIQFTSAPAASATITASFSYYYWVRFADDKYDFEKVSNLLWSLKKLTLRSRRS